MSDWLTVHVGDCRDVLPTLPAASVHCVVTSPPYWGLRDYGTADQLGLEPTPDAYVANMVAVFRDVRRVLRDDGTVWLNLGSSYMNGGPSGPQGQTGQRATRTFTASGLGSGAVRASRWLTSADRTEGTAPSGLAWGDYASTLKPKDMVPTPWMVAMALQADGWYLRSDIIWAKPNPMPESVTDRPTKSHEYVFLLSKSARYYFDADAVREPSSPYSRPQGPHNGTRQKRVERHEGIPGDKRGGLGLGLDAVPYMAGRNLRSVWQIATAHYHGVHFAVFPEALVEPCIKAGTSARGVCPECGAPWERVVEREVTEPQRDSYHGQGIVPVHRGGGDRPGGFYPGSSSSTWRPSCAHDAEPVPATVLDPFAGSGTVGRVANRLSRRAILIDLNPEYLSQIERRNLQVPLGLVG